MSLLKMGILVFLAFVTVSALAGPSTNEQTLITESVSVPAVENCTKHLPELLLWQHGIHDANQLEVEKASLTTLEKISTILLEMKDRMESRQEVVYDENKTCDDSFIQVGSHCLLLAPQDLITWAAARQYCAAKGSELVMLKDANTYAEFLAFIIKMNSIHEVQNIWIGGSDEETEGVWKWINGDLMPSGPPFWGSIDGYRPEPGGGRGENCAILYKPDRHYVHDISCTFKAAPFCEKK